MTNLQIRCVTHLIKRYDNAAQAAKKTQKDKKRDKKISQNI